MIELLFFSLPVIFFAIPWFWKSWKSLITWHVIVSVFINGCLLESERGAALGLGGGGSDAAASGGVAILALLFMFLHLFSSGVKGTLIYMDNERSLKLFPVYAIVGIVSYILIVVVTYYIGRIGVSFILDLDFDTFRKNRV